MTNPLSATCTATRQDFSPYLDGELTGAQMASVAAHLRHALRRAAIANSRPGAPCRNSLADLWPGARACASASAARAQRSPPKRERGTHLSPLLRLIALWKPTLAPLAMRPPEAWPPHWWLLAVARLAVRATFRVQANDETWPT